MGFTIEEIADKKNEVPLHYIKKPAVIFIDGFSMFGISNGDGIKEMADNYPGAKRFSWEEHGKIMDEIKNRSNKGHFCIQTQTPNHIT